MLPAPIGNLADISLRILHLLRVLDVIACEDTRNTQQLFRALGLDPDRPSWVSLHRHNEREATAVVLDRLGQGLRVGYLSDAGTPGISDPGSRLVRAAHQAGRRVLPIPGPSSVTTLLSASGAWLGEQAEFVFVGFLPARGAARAKRLLNVLQDPRPQCLLEAPHRITTLAAELLTGGARGLTVGRELSKHFEEVACIECAQFGAWLAAQPHRTKGEFALVLHETAAAPTTEAVKGERELHALLPHLPLKTAVQIAADLSGGSRKALYAIALAAQRQLT